MNRKLIAIIIIVIIAIIAILVLTHKDAPQPTPQPIKTRIDLTYIIVNEKYLILNDGHTIYYNVELIIKIYAFDSTVTTRTLQFNQTETLNGISYTYGIRLPNISAYQIDIIEITGETITLKK